MPEPIVKIKHFYARAGFGIQPEDYFSSLSLQEHINIQFNAASSLNLYSTKKSRGKRKKSKVDRMQLKQESRWQAKRWFDDMVEAKETVLAEKMSLFWHGHLVCRVILGKKIAADYINALRKNALGNFKDLILDVSKTPAMIRYLNNQQNKKLSPNENFAREVLELFTIGHGQYSEQDIKEAARAFTGWSSTLGGEFVFRKALHDDGQKTFMGHTGNFKGEDIIDIILAQEETAFFISQKVYKHFVSEDVDVSRVQELANTFYKSNYNISILMRSIFESDWFYNTSYVNKMIKSPIQLLVNFCQLTNAEIEGAITFHKYCRKLGQRLLDPPNVAGWPGGKSWIDNASLALRVNMGLILLNPKQKKLLDIRPQTSKSFEIFKNNGSDIRKELASIMFNQRVDLELIPALHKEIVSEVDFDKLIVAYASQLEFQMC